MATLRDVAKIAGVSYSQASFVLNGNNLHRVSKDRQERIKQAMKEVNYRPNRQARQVRQGRTGTLGMLLSAEKDKGTTIVSQIEGMVSEALEHNYLVSILRLTDSQITEGHLPDWLSEICLDGLILHYNQGPLNYIHQAIADIQLPVIWINDRQTCNCVHADEVQAGRLATSTLLAQGHQQIAYVNLHQQSETLNWQHHSIGDRQSGFEQVMQEAGIKPITLQITAPIPQQIQALSVALSQLTDRPTAIIMPYYRHAISSRCVVNALGFKGLANRPVDIMTFVPDLKGSECIWNQIQTILIPQDQMGAMAVQQVLRKIKNPGVSLEPLIITPTVVSH